MEWRGRSTFAEEAEALGVPTDFVFAVSPANDGHRIVVFAHDADVEGVSVTVLASGEDLVLRVVYGPVELAEFLDGAEVENWPAVAPLMLAVTTTVAKGNRDD